jgi:hypothetical protein
LLAPLPRSHRPAVALAGDQNKINLK